MFEPGPQTRILDVGCGAIGLRGLAPDLDITGVDLVAPPGYPGPFVLADASAALPFADGEFDLAYCSSVIEHVPRPRRAAFAAEVRPASRGWYVHTPARLFPDPSPIPCRPRRTGCRGRCVGAIGDSGPAASGRTSSC